MSGVHQLEFEKKRPSLVHLDAPAAFRRDRVVVSYDWANDPDYLVLKLALVDGSTDTLVLRRYVADRLNQLIERLAKRSWKPSSSASENPTAQPTARKAAAAAAHLPATKAPARSARPARSPAAKPAKARAAKAKAKGKR